MDAKEGRDRMEIRVVIRSLGGGAKRKKVRRESKLNQPGNQKRKVSKSVRESEKPRILYVYAKPIFAQGLCSALTIRFSYTSLKQELKEAEI